MLLPSCSHVPVIDHPRGKVCFPPAWGGVVPGITEDGDVVAIHGPGLFSDELGHGGGRYYTDVARSATFVVEIGVDHIIESIEVISGVHLPLGVTSSDTLPVSQRFRPTDGFGNWGELHLGSTRAEVRANLGYPSSLGNEGKDPDLWVYDTDYQNTECYADAGVSIGFEADRIVNVAFYNGE